MITVEQREERNNMKCTKNKTRFILVIVIALVVFNIIAFVVPFVKSDTFYTAYIFGMLSIILQAVIVKIAFKDADTAKSRFYGFPVVQIGGVYLVIQLILSIITMALSVYIPIWIPFILFTVILGVSSVGCISADATREEIIQQEKEDTENTIYMRNMQSKVNMLVYQCNNGDIRTEIENLAESIKYSDPVSNDGLGGIESELSLQIENLQKAVYDNNNKAIEICKRAEDILLERNRLCKLCKNGTVQ